MIRKKNPFHNYEFDYEEQWLNDLAGKGLILVEEGKLSYHFERSDNLCRRYRIIPKKRADFEDDELTLFSDSGWEYLFESNARSIFYTDDQDAPEIFTDDTSYSNYMKKTIRKHTYNMVLCICIVVLWALSLYMNLPGSQNGASGLAERNLLGEIGYPCLIGGLIAAWLYHGIGYYKCRKRMLAGNHEVHAEHFKTRRAFNCIITTVLSICCIVSLIGMFGNSSAIKDDAVMTYSEGRPVLYRDFDPEDWEFVSSHLGSIPSDAEERVRYNYGLYRASNLALVNGCEESFYVSEVMSTNESYGTDFPEYTSLTYDFRSEKTAQRLLLREIGSAVGNARNTSEAKAQAEKISIDVPETDYSGFYEEDDPSGHNVQYLYLRKGKRVVYASYYGDQRLLDKLPLFTDQLVK